MLIIILKKYIIVLFFIISFIKYNEDIAIRAVKSKNEEDDYILINNKYYLRPSLIKKFNNFINICKKGVLTEETKYPLLKVPKISIIIPIYNGGKYLSYSLRTIQNQNLKEIEIIIINDCSTDDSINIIENFMKEEPRIRLIKNYKNRKILYSKSIGALNSNGEFILELDQDDMFIREDLFDIIYKNAKKYNLDLVQFRDFIKEDFFFKRRTRINIDKFHYIKQNKTFYMEKPELKKTLFTKNNNYLLWGLLINSIIYKKVVYYLWEFLINYQFIYNEDYISSTIILILSQNYKFLNIFGIVHLMHQKSASFKCIYKEELQLSNILFPNYLNDYHVKNNPEDIEMIINYIKSNKFLQKKASDLYPQFLEFNIRNILFNNYLLLKDKNEIFKIFNIQRNQSKLLSSYSYYMKYKDYNSILNFQKSIINVVNKTKLNKNYFQYIYVNNSASIFNINKIIEIKSKKNKQKSKRDIHPKISIIIYCNEITFLEETLISIEYFYS